MVKLVKKGPSKAPVAAKSKPTVVQAKSKAKSAALPARAARPALKASIPAKKATGTVKTMPVPAKKPVAKPVALKAPAKSVVSVAAAPAVKAKVAPVVAVKTGMAKNGTPPVQPAVARIAAKPQLIAGLANARPAAAVKPTKVARPRPEPIPVRLPPAPVRSDSKMARNKAGITTRELERFRDLLYEKRREITGDVSSMETSALRSSNGNLSTLPMHMADTGTDNYEQEFTLGLVEKDRKLLHEINVALAKIQDGSYGICEGTGKPIAKPRLEAQPWAKYSIEHARQLERPQFRRAF